MKKTVRRAGKKARVRINLPIPLNRRLSAVAKLLRISRSAVVRLAVLAALDVPAGEWRGVR